jgi:hypothetical protein
MVSKTLQSLDAWLAQAEELLAEQSRFSDPEQLKVGVTPTHEPVQLTLFDVDDYQ